MRVGNGNRLEGCYAHDNIDDGYDLFNKIEDGANGIVVIENSIARNNTSNGFKLGGEGQPVAHEIHNSVAVGNHLDGFADNISLRSHEGKYDDAISGHVDNSNYFIRDGRTENSEGNQLSVNDFQSLKLPMPLQRNADGSFQTDDFLTKQ